MGKRRIFQECLQKDKPSYKTWKSMQDRCRLTNVDRIDRCYWNKGIRVCDEWKRFSAFFEWAMKNGYRKGLHIDRIDNMNGYYPENCRFVTPKQNSRNRDYMVIWEFKGEKKTVGEWAEVLNMSNKTLRARFYDRKWPVEKILTTPIKPYIKVHEKWRVKSVV